MCRTQLILASASPRRKTLLAAAGLDAEPIPADVDEEWRAGESPDNYVRRVAAMKAETVSRDFPDRIVLGADTVVVIDDTIFGKPADLDEAERTLRHFSGRWHDVLTGIALIRAHPPHRKEWVCRTRVRFRDLTDEEIRRYCLLVNPLDKAGAYGIQEHGHLLVAEVDGLRSNVVGLPVEQVLEALAAVPEWGLGCATPTELS